MEALYYLFSWGSPVGLGTFFLLTGIGASIFIKAIAQCIESKRQTSDSADGSND
jgi:hypothetical protein